MILVLLGTNPYSFERLARAVDELAARHGWDVFIQMGNTPYQPKHCQYATFLPRAEVAAKARECELMIVQGGTGSIHEGLAAGKPVVAVPRRPQLGESQDYQEDLVRAMEAQGRLLGVYEIDQLEVVIERARSFRAAPGPGNRISSLVRDYLESL